MNNNNWREEQKKKRNKAYNLIDETAKLIVNKNNVFQVYLDVQSRFSKHSVGNALLITAQKPSATFLKPYSVWKDLGSINKNHTKILILEPGKEFVKENGAIATYFNPKELIDISDTDVKLEEKSKEYSNNTKLTALLSQYLDKIQVVDELPDNQNIAYWNQDEKKIYIKRNPNTEDTFKEVAKAIYKSLCMYDNEEDKNFFSNCVSYMLCKKYNIDFKEKISDIPSSLKDCDSKEIRQKLSDMKNIFNDIESNMNLYISDLDKNSKEHNPQNKEVNHER